MKRNNKTCLVCQTKYTYCSSCEEFARLPRWMTCFCGENCHNVFNIISLYEDKHISLEEAKQKLDACDLSKIKTNETPASRIIENIYKTSIKEESDIMNTVSIDSEVAESKVKPCKRNKKEL
ncbi:MAG: hypothetical protein Q4G33_14575 [bacterium]|nr:hypothetical protein [bacterium]